MSMDGSKAIMADLEKQLSNVLDAFNEAGDLSIEEKIQAFYAYSMDNDESKLKRLLKLGVSLEKVKREIHQVILNNIKHDTESDWEIQAKELFAILKSDRAEQVKAKIEQSGGSVKDILNGILQKALDESEDDDCKEYCLDYMVPAIELGANPNCQNEDGWTAMMVAAMYVEKPDEIIQMMLDKGADPTKRDNFFDGVVWFARNNEDSKNKKQTIRLLKDAIKEYKLKQKALKPKRNFLGFKKG